GSPRPSNRANSASMLSTENGSGLLFSGFGAGRSAGLTSTGAFLAASWGAGSAGVGAGEATASGRASAALGGSRRTGSGAGEGARGGAGSTAGPCEEPCGAAGALAGVDGGVTAPGRSSRRIDQALALRAGGVRPPPAGPPVDAGAERGAAGGGAPGVAGR